MNTPHTSLIILLVVVLVAPVASAQQDCATTRNEEGQIAFELCIREERESTVRANVSKYKDEIDDEISDLRAILDQEDDRRDLEKDRVKYHVKTEINGINRKIKQMRRNDVESNEITLEQRKITDLRTAERLFIRISDEEQDILEDEVNKQIHILRLSLYTYEQQLRETASNVRLR